MAKSIEEEDLTKILDIVKGEIVKREQDLSRAHHGQMIAEAKLEELRYVKYCLEAALDNSKGVKTNAVS